MSGEVQIWEYPREWYRFSNVRFQLRSSSLVAARPWAGGSSIYGPHAQVWIPKLTASITDESVWPDISAFFAQLGGQAGLIRIGDASLVTGGHNRELMAQKQTFSDGTSFSDGTGFVDGMMPPSAHLIEPVRQGAVWVKIGGLLPNVSGALRRGDMIEFRPNGIADATPRLHKITVPGNTNGSGECGVKITPPLRSGLARGDQAVLEYPTSVFHLIDDSQGEMEVTPPLIANFGFSLVEAIENV